ncbi:MAG: tRNA pseudouridine(38-40) synthase TruA [Candidatus Omnitrophica bacterium]|nr:tRNA pseudouridine(38-40) synthase TruA [Candidatus Omnitrophota bacterium]
MRTVKLTLGFVGTRYEGWQGQRKKPSASSGLPTTVQEILEKFLSKILKEKTAVTGSSRTDSGVHALGLVAHFRTRNPLPDLRIKEALNFYLPRDIVVFSAKTVPGGFHARFSAKSKLYRYDIRVGPTRPLFESPFVLWHPRRLDLRLMKRAARFFIGRHDFSAFHDQGDKLRNHEREVRRLSVRKSGSLVRIEIEADGFLRHMVRVIVGTLLEAGRKRLAPESIPQILLSKDRAKAGPTAKPHGLTLVRVNYRF